MKYHGCAHALLFSKIQQKNERIKNSLLFKIYQRLNTIVKVNVFAFSTTLQIFYLIIIENSQKTRRKLVFIFFTTIFN